MRQASRRTFLLERTTGTSAQPRGFAPICESSVGYETPAARMVLAKSRHFTTNGSATLIARADIISQQPPNFVQAEAGFLIRAGIG
jgi:hypothetical protein